MEDFPIFEPESNEEASPPPTSPPPTEELEKLKSELRECRESYLHALAEGENSRKRLQKERQEMIQHAMQKVVVEFLGPIDQLENALKYADQASPEVKNWAVGFNMIASQFKAVLASHGAHPFSSEGKPFDPHYHEAIEMVVTEEHPPGTVVKEHTRGYTMGGQRVIRPARVHVSRAPDAVEKAAEKEEEGGGTDDININAQGGS